MKAAATRHPKTMQLARLLGITRRDAVGVLELLFTHTAEYAKRGDIGRFTDEQIAEAVDWPVDRAGELVQALLGCGSNGSWGYIETDPEHRLIIHDWADHAPDHVRKALRRSGLEFVRTMSGQCPPKVGQNPPTKPSLTEPNQAKSSAAPTASDGGKPPAATPAKPEKINFDWQARKFVGIAEADLAEWREAYPAVNVEQGIRQAGQWLLSNPTKRKKNYRRFLTNWFSRAQERGGNRANGPPAQQGETVAEQLARLKREGQI